MGKYFFITGRPGVGKTSIILNIMRLLKEKGHEVGGMISRDVRSNGVRVGFEVEDFRTGTKGWLAHKNLFKGPRIGKYFVNISDLDNVGVRAIMNAMVDPKIDLIVIDEIGPMELLSKNFVEAVLNAIESKKPLLGSIHQKAKHFLIENIKSMEDTIIILITLENRDQICEDLYRAILKSLSV